MSDPKSLLETGEEASNIPWIAGLLVLVLLALLNPTSPGLLGSIGFLTVLLILGWFGLAKIQDGVTDFGVGQSGLKISARRAEIGEPVSAQQQLKEKSTETRTALAAAVNQVLSEEQSGISPELSQKVLAMIDAYGERSFQNGIAILNSITKRLIFEAVLSAPASWYEIVTHLTYALSGRTDSAAILDTDKYATPLANELIAQGSVHIYRFGNTVVLYNPRHHEQVAAAVSGSQQSFGELDDPPSPDPSSNDKVVGMKKTQYNN